MKSTWSDAKRTLNLSRHQLEFADAEIVLCNPSRLDVVSARNGHERGQSFAVMFERLAVPTVVNLPGERPHHQLSPGQPG